MPLPQIKEREYRFKLALRIGIPIFALILAFISHTFITAYENLQISFYIESAILVIVSIYFILYLIYKGFDVSITDKVSNTFSREYLYNYLKKEIEKEKDYTLLLISIDNLYDINNLYGIRNGDKVLYRVAKWISEYFEDKDIHNFPIGHVKGGELILGFKGLEKQYKTLYELLSLKSVDMKIDDIEVKVSSAITDTSYSHDLDHLIENLFHTKEENQKNKKYESIDPTELESFVINALKNKSFTVSAQSVFYNRDNNSVIKECFVRLKAQNGKLLHPKSYMKVLNRLGLSVEYDLMILEQNIKRCTFDTNDIVAFNISAISLRNPTFLSRAKDIIKTNQMTKNKIMFILSEMEYYSNIDRFNTILNSLRDIGVYIALDRLGAIHTSFLYLRDLDIDVIRFDSSYTKDIKKYKNVISGFSAMGHQKGIKTWIKMVEDQDTKDFISFMDIDYVQGKYLSDIEFKYEN
jgi:EAL domain-containing protein (putative c-di-GMP-specific phosphodiesterase class I)/GGDEF domain-containing protein